MLSRCVAKGINDSIYMAAAQPSNRGKRRKPQSGKVPVIENL